MYLIALVQQGEGEMVHSWYLSPKVPTTQQALLEMGEEFDEAADESILVLNLDGLRDDDDHLATLLSISNGRHVKGDTPQGGPLIEVCEKLVSYILSVGFALRNAEKLLH